MIRSLRKIPAGVCCAALLVGAAEPLAHLWIAHGLPKAAAPTGFHIGDDPFFLTAMQIFLNDFFSPYATCQSPAGAHSLLYFALPHHWLYGALGLVAALLHLDPLFFLSLANGLGVACYLLAGYVFLHAALPQRAGKAFLLFVFYGGLGGLLYCGSALFGLHEAPGFETWFHRYARYELIEGPFLSPWLVAPRLYYTLPLTLGFLALASVIHSAGQGQGRVRPAALILLLLTAWFNARLGPLFWMAAGCFLLLREDIPPAARVRMLALAAVPVFVGCAAAALQLRLNPSAGENVSELLRRCAWFGSLLSLCCWHLFAVPAGLHKAFDGLSRWSRGLAGAAAGYLAAFALLYGAHQFYYGNLLAGGDTAAAIRISDWALPGAAAGFLAGLWRRGAQRAPSGVAWLGLWLLLSLAVAVSAFGQGWFLRFMPERVIAVLGLPLAAVSAEGLARIRTCRPAAASVLLSLMIGCGLCSIAVGALCLQGPLGQVPGAGPFQWTHSEIMSPVDERLIGKIEAGVVAAPASQPPLFGDIIVRRNPRTRTIFGQPSLEFGGINMLAMSRELQRFFRADAESAFRRTFLEQWCVDYVYCPETRPVDPAVLDQLAAAAGLQLVARESRAALFRVNRAEAAHE